MKFSNKKTLEQNALKIRMGIIRAISSNKGGHIGGSMDLADMLSVVYTDFIRLNPDNPKDENRDFMIFSKGHAGPALYSSLVFKGILPAVLITTVLFIPCYIWLPVSWLYFFLGAAGFCAVYITLLMIFGFNSAEKNEIKYYVNTVLRKLKIKK